MCSASASSLITETLPLHVPLVLRLAAVFADYPGYCPAVPVHGPSTQPEVCNQLLYDGDFCSTSQPEWSAFREPSFGHSVLDILNDTHAHFAWYRNQDADTCELTWVGVRWGAVVERWATPGLDG